MALGFNFSEGGSGGEIIPIVKFDCRSGRMFRRDRVNGEDNIVDVSRTFKAVFDFENIEVGYINFDTGSAPDFQVVRFGQKQPDRPSDKHKPGVRLLVKLAKEVGGDVRELASTARAFLRGIDDLHSAYAAGATANPGKLPVVVIKDTVAITTGEGARKSTNYSPVFEIVGWVARPADLVYKPKNPVAAQAPQAAAQTPASYGGPPATGSTSVAPPASTSDAEDFG
jgi:hypothetical protein